MAESFFWTLQLELLDEHRWEPRRKHEWIEAWYNPRRRHSYCDMLSPANFEDAYSARIIGSAA